MKRLICTAAAFGYGPVAKLLTICNFLTDYRLEFIGTGPALELASHASYFSAITEADCNSDDGHLLFQRILVDADLLLVVGEPEVVELASTTSTPCCYVDSLFWMWDTLPEACYEVACYCVQRFPGVSRKLATFGQSVRNLRLVGPIVDRTFQGTNERDPFLLVSLGGLESPLVRKHESLLYVEPVISVLDRALQTQSSPWTEVIVTSNQAMTIYLQEHYQRPGITFTHLAHEDFLKLLARATLLLTSPGLTTTYEALVYQVPIRFLPPQNYSQSLMLQLYRNNGLANLALNWDDLYPEALIVDDLPEEVGVRQVLASIQRFAADPGAQEVAVSVFRELLSSPPPESSSQAACLGIPLTDGAQEVAAIITNELLEEGREKEI